MSSPAPESAATSVPPAAPLLSAWRDSGAWRLDPARFHTLEALAHRLDRQPSAVQRILQDKLAQGLADFARRLAAAPPGARQGAPAQGPGATADPKCPPLAALNASIRQTRALRGRPSDGDELASVDGFREAWSRIHAQEQVARAATRQPMQAGPLNSQVLAFEALARMGEISPGYLRRFMLYVESLQWLEAASLSEKPQADKAGRRRAPPKAKSRPSRAPGGAA